MRRALLLLLCSTCLAPAFAISDNAGTKNGDFLRIPTDARGVALGDAVVSMPKGTDSLHWNPAGLGNLDSREVSATHVEYYQDVRIENVAAAYPLEEGGLAASVFYLSPGGSLDGRDDLGNPTGDFKFYDLVGTLGFGRKMLTRAEGADVSVGVALKLVQEKIADQSYNNPAFDIGIQASPKDDLNLGFTVRNLASGKADFVRELVGGASYTIYHAFTGAVGINYSNDSPVRYSVSGEYKIPDVDAALRAGYQTHDDLDSSTDSQIPALRGASIAGLKLGAGMGYKPPQLPSLKFDLDYAMAPFGALGISHTITVKMKW